MAASNNTKKKNTQRKSSNTSKKTSTSSRNSKAAKAPSSQDMELWYEVGLIILFAFMVFLFLCNFGLVGPIGVFFKNIMFGLFGFAAYIMPVLLFVGTFFGWVNKGHPAAKRKIIAGAVLFLLLGAVGELAAGRLNEMKGYNVLNFYENSIQYSNGGGVFGGTIAYFLNSTLDMIGSILVLLVAGIICMVLITEKSFVKSVQKTGKAFATKARSDARNMREYAAERSQKREEVRYEQLRLREEQLQSKEQQRKELVDKRLSGEEKEVPALPDRNRKVSGINFRSIFSKLGEDGRDDSSADKNDVLLAVDDADINSNGTGSENSERVSAVSSNIVSMEAARSMAELRRGASIVEGAAANAAQSTARNTAEKAAQALKENGAQNASRAVRERTGKSAMQVSRETVAKSLTETDELHELRPKGSYHTQERINFVNLEPQKKESAEVKEESSYRMPQPEQNEKGYSAQENTEYAGSQAESAGFGAQQDAKEAMSAQAENMAYDRTVQQEPQPQVQHAEPVELTYSSEQSQVSMVEVHTQEAHTAEIRAEELRPKNTGREDNRPKAVMKDDSLVPKSAMQPVEKPYLFPPISLLQKGKNTNPRDGQKHLEETARRLQECLKTFGVNVTITDISQGPAVTRYELQPEQGVKVSKIVNLSDDIKLNLAATDIRIEAPIPGKSAIGIEVPNKENSTVAFRELIESQEFQNFPSKISFAVGKDIAGKNVVADIGKMPHMLIAGATGSGKSVCINTLIMSILYKARPDEVKMIMIDPKVVELSSYNGIPHLLIPVVTDPKQAAGALQWGVSEMMARYEKFAEFNVRDMKGFNAKIDEKAARGEENLPKKLPQIVIIVDELADLMMVAPGEVEEAICRLAQLARAAGIHLIVATQRPSVAVITGLIKANMPSRVAFAVSSGVDSRTILDMNGAEKLLGKGDMLFYPQGYSKPVRVQGAFVSDAEVGAVVDYLKNQQIGNVYQEDIIQSQINNLKSGGSNASGAAGGRSDDKDALFADAGRFIIEKDKASIGMLQRVFKIGFNRAARIVDQLCEYGVVGDEEGTKPRKVLMSLEQFENLLEEI